MYEDKFDKLERKVDDVKEDVSEVKTEVAKLGVKFEADVLHSIKNHIEGDNKIINQLSPILHALNEMVVDHQVKKVNRKKLAEKLVNASKIVSIIGGIVGIVITIYKAF